MIKKTLTVAIALIASAAFAAPASADDTAMNITFYGAPDNDPPNSADIAYSQIHTQAGGTGTYADPITFATDATELAPGTIIYVAPLQKYFIMEDGCAECQTDWASGVRHIDLWTGFPAGYPNPTPAQSQAVIDCENALTPTTGAQTVIVGPPNNLPVDPTPLFDPTTGQCAAAPAW